MTDIVERLDAWLNIVDTLNLDDMRIPKGDVADAKAEIARLRCIIVRYIRHVHEDGGRDFISDADGYSDWLTPAEMVEIDSYICAAFPDWGAATTDLKGREK